MSYFQGDLAVHQLCMWEGAARAARKQTLKAAFDRAQTMMCAGAITPALCNQMCRAYLQSMSARGNGQAIAKYVVWCDRELKQSGRLEKLGALHGIISAFVDEPGAIQNRVLLVQCLDNALGTKMREDYAEARQARRRELLREKLQEVQVSLRESSVHLEARIQAMVLRRLNGSSV